MLIEELHNKGTYNNPAEVWLKIPNGGNSEEDYVIINGTKCYWSFSADNWVTDGVVGTVVDNTQVVNDDVDIKKNLTVEGSTKLKSLSLNDEDILNMFLRKDEQDSASETISFIKGINFSNGSSILKGDDDKWHLIVDDETINGKKLTDILRYSDIGTINEGTASDINILSALKAINTFLRRDTECTANEKVTFLKGINFTNGASISYVDGSWNLTIGSVTADKLTVNELSTKITTNINGKSISDVIRTSDDIPASDTNVFSALKASSMFLRKDVADTALETMYFAKDTHVIGTAYACDLNVTDKAIINEVDVTELKATNGTFSNLMKAAAATIVGLATIGTVSATAINADSLAVAKGTIETLGATTINVDTINATGTTTSLNLVVQSLAKTYNMEVDNVATIVQIILSDYISSSTFTTGFSGSGFKLWKNSDSWNLELDTLTVRKVMNVFELLINKIRSVNGGLIVSPGNGKIKAVSLADSVYTLEIEGDMTFATGDLVRCQTFRTTGSKYYWVPITTVSGSNIIVAESSFSSSLPEVGDELVQFGNTTNTDRQGALYLVASEDGKPRIEVLNGISSTDLTGKVKAVLGDLDGITDTDFSSISGYGLYAQNVYLKGTFMLHSGVTVETAVANAQSSAIVTANGYADTAIANIQIGGTNLFGFNKGILFGIDIPDSNINGYHCYYSSSNLLGRIQNLGFAGVGGDFTVSFYAKASVSLVVNVNLCDVGTDNSYTNLTDTYTKFVYVFKNVFGYVGTDMYGFLDIENTGDVNAVVDIKNIKIERGAKATDWSPAPEDSVTTTVYQSGITALQNSIALKVSQTDFNALGTRVSSTESAINLLPGTIDARITTQINSGGSIYTAVAASLTLDGNGISLFGKTINISGATIFSSLATNTSVSTAISNIQVGGTNILDGTQRLNGNMLFNEGYSTVNDYLGFTSTNYPFQSSNYVDILGAYNLSNLKINTYYTLSFYAKSTVDGDCMVSYFYPNLNGSGADGITNTYLTTAWKKYSITWYRQSTDAVNLLICRLFSGYGSGTVYICAPKFEEGNKSTAWSPSPEDFAISIGYSSYSALQAAAAASATIIDNGKIRTTLIEAVAVVANGLSAQTINANNATLLNLNVNTGTFTSIAINTATISGSLTCTNATFNNGTFNSITINTATINNATVTGNITATTGKVGPFTISTSQLSATNNADNLLLNASLIKFYNSENTVYIGGDVMPSTLGGALSCPVRLECARVDNTGYDGNACMYLSSTGATSSDSNVISGNHALFISKGNICGLRFRVRRFSSDITATVMDTVFLGISNGNDYALTLPSSGVEDGQFFLIRKCGTANMWINGTIQDGWTGNTTSIEIQNRQMHIFIYDSANSRWTHNYWN